MERVEYFYPDDIIIEVINGKRHGRLGYDISEKDHRKTITLKSELDVLFDEQDISELKQLYHKIWLRARENYRAELARIFLDKYHPNARKERQSWEDYYEKNKNSPKFGIGHWRSLQAKLGAGGHFKMVDITEE